MNPTNNDLCWCQQSCLCLNETEECVEVEKHGKKVHQISWGNNLHVVNSKLNAMVSPF